VLIESLIISFETSHFNNYNEGFRDSPLHKGAHTQ